MESGSNYPTIEEVCKVAAKVFAEENKTWKVRATDVVSPDEVQQGNKLSGGICFAAADCRAITAHLISKHVPVYNAAERKPHLLSDRQIGVAMGGVSHTMVSMLKSRACKLFSRYEYGSIYYAILLELTGQGFDLWCLPKDLTKPMRA